MSSGVLDGKALVQSILETLAGAEAWHDAGWDVDLLGWVLWVDTNATLAHFGKEGAKASQGELVAALERGGNEVNVGVDNLFALLFGDLEFLYEIRHEIALLEFIHTMHAPYGVL